MGNEVGQPTIQEIHHCMIPEDDVVKKSAVELCLQRMDLYKSYNHVSEQKINEFLKDVQNFAENKIKENVVDLVVIRITKKE